MLRVLNDASLGIKACAFLSVPVLWSSHILRSILGPTFVSHWIFVVRGFTTNILLDNAVQVGASDGIARY